MSAQAIYDHTPLGALVRYGDGSLRPPERSRPEAEVKAWKHRNSRGRLVAKTPGRVTGSCVSKANITLHEGYC